MADCTPETFYEQDAFGKVCEEKVLDALSKTGWEVKWRPEVGQKHSRDALLWHPKWDFCAVEIKNESKMSHTGNIAVEMTNNYKPSGILVSTADVFIHYLGDPLVAIYQKEAMLGLLRRLRRSGGLVLRYCRKADNHSRVVLLPISTLPVGEGFDVCSLLHAGASLVFARRIA